MVTVDANDVSCHAFDSIAGAPTGKLVQFIVGVDTQPKVLPAAEIASGLHDPFATLLLSRGVFPAAAEAVFEAIDAVVGPDDLVGSNSQSSFILGENSQVLVSAGGPRPRASLRFLVSRGSGRDGPEIILSAFSPTDGLVELMAWDIVAKGFNYYRSIGDHAGEWVFAGNSRHALSPPSKGKGPFESHPSGNLIMKELKLPWLHWHSFKVAIVETAFEDADARRTHPWFVGKEGAESCETKVVIPSIIRWTNARFDLVIGAGGEVTDPAGVIQQIVMSPTVNFITSETESSVVAGAGPLNMPPTFFVDADGFAAVDLPQPPPLEVSRAIYQASLEKFDFSLRDGAFEQVGDTHFAFVVPERAFEDIQTMKEAIKRGLVTKRLVAALLMVDFPNPVFSPRRAQLLGHAPSAAKIVSNASTYSDDMAARILAAEAASPPDSPEREFAALWRVGPDDWPAVFGTSLNQYYSAIKKKLKTQTGFNNYVRVAESTRNRVRQMPIFEFGLVFPHTNIPEETVMMKRDGTIEVVA